MTQVQEQKVANEMQLYLGGTNTKTKSLRDQYTRKIQEQENVGKALRDKQKEIKQCHGSCMNQVFLMHTMSVAYINILGENVERFKATVPLQARVLCAIPAAEDASGCR